MTKAGERGAKDMDAETSAGSAARPAFPGGEGSGGPAGSKTPPLMSHPTAAMAAATAIGFGFASQWAGIFAGIMQGVAASMERTALERAGPSAARDVADPVSASPTQDGADAPQPVEAKVAKAAPVKAAAPVTVQTAKAESPKPAARQAKANRKPKAVAEAVVAVPERVIAKTEEPPKAGAQAVAKAKRAPARKSGADDLKEIAGIGPRLEQELLTKGISRFAAIAAWSAEEAERIDGELGLSGRVLRDDWIGKAKALVAKAG